jgi:hypothetical protein
MDRRLFLLGSLAGTFAIPPVGQAQPTRKRVLSGLGPMLHFFGG